MKEIRNITHDLVNKFAILNVIVLTAESKNTKISTETISPVVIRIGEIINNLCESVLRESPRDPQNEWVKFQDFSIFVSESLEKLMFLFPQCHIFLDDQIQRLETEFFLDKDLFYSVLENIIENSVNANATTISLSFLERNSEFHLIIEDNGKIKKSPRESRTLPHGIGKNIIFEGLKSMKAKIKMLAQASESYRIDIQFLTRS
ncbi:MAG: hypothetical protein K2P81_13150 [Bacteriovoracaceae bacterium]|nr:hypothetical protein [Bacteriovoracaceae bacterium]